MLLHHAVVAERQTSTEIMKDWCSHLLQTLNTCTCPHSKHSHTRSVLLSPQAQSGFHWLGGCLPKWLLFLILLPSSLTLQQFLSSVSAALLQSSKRFSFWFVHEESKINDRFFFKWAKLQMSHEFFCKMKCLMK